MKTIEELEDEKDKALLISKYEDPKIKYDFIEKIKDINNKSLIVMSIDNDELKLEYINKVEDEGIKALLILSLKDRNLRDSLINSEEKKYKKINIPDDVTVGMEIECEGEKTIECFMIENFCSGWHAKNDTSLEEGVELTTPIFTNKEDEVEDLYCVCNVLEKLGQTVSQRCGGHIHIGADCLKTKQSYMNLIELWANNEDIFYLINNKPGEISREGVFKYASPISRKLLEAIRKDRFSDYNSLSKDEFIERMKMVQQEGINVENSRTGINFLNVGNFNNTIEFRLSNGTIDPNIWIENAILYGNMVAFSQKLSDIQLKEPSERTDEENDIIEKFKILKTKETSQQERIKTLLDLCIPENFRQIYIDRFNDNKDLLAHDLEMQTKLSSQISEKTISILTESSVIKIARRPEVAKRMVEAQEQLDMLEEHYKQSVEEPTIDDQKNSILEIRPIDLYDASEETDEFERQVGQQKQDKQKTSRKQLRTL